jgi:hypothetical protein
MTYIKSVRSSLAITALSLGAVLASISPVSIGEAEAAIISGTYHVEASNFSGVAGTPPFSTFEGDFTLSFDDAAVDVVEGTVIAENVNIPFDTPVVFTYVPQTDKLIIGAAGFTGVHFDQRDFLINIDSASTANPTLVGLSYTATGSHVFFSRDGSVTFTPIDSTPIPEPSSLMVMLGSLGVLGFVRWRRRQS